MPIVPAVKLYKCQGNLRKIRYSSTGRHLYVRVRLCLTSFHCINFKAHQWEWRSAWDSKNIGLLSLWYQQGFIVCQRPLSLWSFYLRFNLCSNCIGDSPAHSQACQGLFIRWCFSALTWCIGVLLKCWRTSRARTSSVHDLDFWVRANDIETVLRLEECYGLHLYSVLTKLPGNST